MSDSIAATITTTTTTTTTLRRHSSLITPKRTQPLSFVSHSLHNLNLDTLHTPPSSSYTSLRDILLSTTAGNSPATGSSSCCEIPIRNHLVKQAAWAYLQPMSTSTISSSPAPHLLRRLRHRVAAFLSFVNHRVIPNISQFFHRILHALCAS